MPEIAEIFTAIFIGIKVVGLVTINLILIVNF